MNRIKDVEKYRTGIQSGRRKQSVKYYFKITESWLLFLNILWIPQCLTAKFKLKNLISPVQKWKGRIVSTFHLA